MADQINARPRQPIIFRIRPDFLYILTEQEVNIKYRLSKQQIEDLHNQIEDGIAHIQ